MPNNIGPRLNCLRCGSNVAEIKPIEALVAAIANEHISTPGIFRTVNKEAIYKGNLYLIKIFKNKENT